MLSDRSEGRSRRQEDPFSRSHHTSGMPDVGSITLDKKTSSERSRRHENDPFYRPATNDADIKSIQPEKKERRQRDQEPKASIESQDVPEKKERRQRDQEPKASTETQDVPEKKERRQRDQDPKTNPETQDVPEKKERRQRDQEPKASTETHLTQDVPEKKERRQREAPEDLRQFLERIELKNYLPLFENAYLNIDAVVGLCDEDLVELGIKLSSHRRQLLSACAAQKEKNDRMKQLSLERARNKSRDDVSKERPDRPDSSHSRRHEGEKSLNRDRSSRQKS